MFRDCRGARDHVRNPLAATTAKRRVSRSVVAHASSFATLRHEAVGTYSGSQQGLRYAKSS